MLKESVSTRRLFLKGGALAAAPLAIAAAPALAADDRNARLTRLEDEAAIRDLHQTWLGRINAGEHSEARQMFADPGRARFAEGVRRLASTGEPDLIQLASDGLSAIGRFSYEAETHTALPRDSTLAQMAHAQGEGLVRRTERRVLTARYVKSGGTWAIARIELQAAQA